MILLSWLAKADRRLDLVAGLTDGILTALILASGKLIAANGGIGLGLAWRVAAAAALSQLFVFFVAHYAELRGRLIRAERELNLTSHGRLAATSLGRAVLRDAFKASLTATGFSFIGALIPLVTSALLPRPAWLGVLTAIVILAGLGVVLARAVAGRPLYWGVGLALGGIVVTLAGTELDIVA